MNFEWHDVEKKLEEEEFKKEKGEQQKENQDNQQKEETGQQDSEPPKSIGLAAIIYETWNSIAGPKGYDEVNPAQKTFLDKHTAKLEAKWLKDIELLPELEAGLSHVVVYLPKWVKYQKTHKTAKKEE